MKETGKSLCARIGRTINFLKELLEEIEKPEIPIPREVVEKYADMAARHGPGQIAIVGHS